MINVVVNLKDIHHNKRFHLVWDDKISKKASGIYKITSPTGRVYIGQSKNIYLRIRTYLIKNPTSNKSQHLLQRSFDKHVIVNHKFEIICSFDFHDKTLLNDLEKHYIRVYNSFSDWHFDDDKKGLNLTSGGTYKSIAAKSTCAKRRIKTGKRKNFWYKPTESHKKAIAEGIRGIKRVQDEKYWNNLKKRCKTVYMFNWEGELVRELWNCGELSSQGYTGASVNKCCTGKLRYYNDHFFSYDKYFKPNYEGLAKRYKVPIYRYDAEMNFIKMYKSTYDVRLDGFNHPTIAKGTFDADVYNFKNQYFSRRPIHKRMKDPQQIEQNVDENAMQQQPVLQ